MDLFSAVPLEHELVCAKCKRIFRVPARELVVKNTCPKCGAMVTVDTSLIVAANTAQAHLDKR